MALYGGPCWGERGREPIDVENIDAIACGVARRGEEDPSTLLPFWKSRDYRLDLKFFSFLFTSTSPHRACVTMADFPEVAEGAPRSIYSLVSQAGNISNHHRQGSVHDKRQPRANCSSFNPLSKPRRGIPEYLPWGSACSRTVWLDILQQWITH